MRVKERVLGLPTPRGELRLQFGEGRCQGGVGSEVVKLMRIVLQVVELVAWRFLHHSVGRADFG